MFILLIVAFVRNYEPFLPPAGSGLFGLEDAALLVNDDPVPEAFDCLAAMNLVLFDLKLLFLAFSVLFTMRNN